MECTTLDELIEGTVVDPELTHEWLVNWLNILNGTSMTEGDPGFKGYTSHHKMKSHWDNYVKKKNLEHDKRRRGLINSSIEEIQETFHAQCQFSVINDTVDKNFLVRAIVTKALRRNNIIVTWHTNSPQTWSSELRFSANGMAQINPEIMTLDQWAKFRKDFHLESFMTQDKVLYMHVLEEVTMFHTSVRARGGKGATFDVSDTIYNPPNTTDEQKNFVECMYKQCDLVCSDMEIIALQNDTKLPMNNKLIFMEGDDHVKSQMAASGQVLPNFFPDRRRYTIFGEPDQIDELLEINHSIPQLTQANEEDRQHYNRVILSTQVEDTSKEPWKEVRIPKFNLRNERAKLVQQRRLRLSKAMSNWQIEAQLAREKKVLYQVHPDPKYKPVMPKTWIQSQQPDRLPDPFRDDIRMGGTYRELLKESPTHFQQVHESFKTQKYLVL